MTYICVYLINNSTVKIPKMQEGILFFRAYLWFLQQSYVMIVP